MNKDMSMFEDMDEDMNESIVQNVGNKTPKDISDDEDCENEEENEDEEDNEEDIFAEIGVKDAKKNKAKTTASKPAVVKEVEFTGPRPVLVYGQEMFVELDPKVTLEAIRARIVNEFKFPEFSADRTNMSFDKTTGIIVPCIEFKKKG